MDNTLKTLIIWIIRTGIILVGLFMFFRLITTDQATIADKIIFTFLIAIMTTFALGQTGILSSIINKIYTWMAGNGGLVIMIAIVLVYIFLRALQ